MPCNCGNSPCNCSPANCCPDSACTDPGVVASGRHLQVLDYKFCEKRLANQEGFAVCQIASGGTPEIIFTNEPCVQPKTLQVDIGETFGGFSCFLGDNGCLRTIVPGPENNGWLRADGGLLSFQNLPPDNALPDPLQVNELIVNDTASVAHLVVGGTACFDSLPEGDIASLVGLSGDGCMVKGTVSTGPAVAYYYETADTTLSYSTSTDGPNALKVDNQSAVIGNEIFDPAQLAHVLSDTVIRVDKPGDYLAIWHGEFDDRNGGGYSVTLNLKLNGTVVAMGNGRANIAGVDNGTNLLHQGRITGFHALSLSANDNIEIRIGRSAGGPSTNALLHYAKLILVRLRAAV